MSNKILDDMRDVMRRRHYSIRTERSYFGWVKRFILHFNMKSRDDLRREEDRNLSEFYTTRADYFHRVNGGFDTVDSGLGEHDLSITENNL